MKTLNDLEIMKNTDAQFSGTEYRHLILMLTHNLVSKVDGKKRNEAVLAEYSFTARKQILKDVRAEMDEVFRDEDEWT